MLFTAIAFEVCGTTSMKALSASHPAWSLAAATAGISISYFFASRAMERLPVGLAYAVWSGVGLAGVSILSFLFFQEQMPMLKLLGLLFIIWGMIVIKMDKKTDETSSEGVRRP